MSNLWKKAKRIKNLGVRKRVDLKKTMNERTIKRVNVLACIFATFAVFQLEMSELNTYAYWNAVEVKAMVDPIQNKSRRRRTKKWGRVRKQNSKEETRNGRTKKWSGRTSSHVRHRRRLPLGKIRVECRCTIKRCRSQCHGGPNPKQVKKKNEEIWGRVRKQKSKEETRKGSTTKCSEPTCLHGRHLCRVPLGNI